MIGIIADSIDAQYSKDYLLFKALNTISETHDCYLFTNRVISLPMNNKFAILQQVEAMHHSGILIATSIFNAQIVSKSLMASKKYFYIWNPEWMFFNVFYTKQLNNIFHNNEMDLITRSDSHFNLIKKLFKEPLGTVYNWDINQLIKVLNV